MLFSRRYDLQFNPQVKQILLCRTKIPNLQWWSYTEAGKFFPKEPESKDFCLGGPKASAAATLSSTVALKEPLNKWAQPNKYLQKQGGHSLLTCFW